MRGLNLTTILDLLEPTIVVNDLFSWMAVTLIGGVGVVIWRWDKTKKEKRKLKIILSSEIEEIQKALKPLSNCRNKAFNEYDEISDDDKLPDELNFDSTIYSNNLDKIYSLDQKWIIKVVQYYKKIGEIEEWYKKFELIHDNYPYCLSIIELQEVRSPSSSPSLDEILKFLSTTEIVYDLGEELMHSLKEGRG